MSHSQLNSNHRKFSIFFRYSRPCLRRHRTVSAYKFKSRRIFIFFRQIQSVVTTLNANCLWFFFLFGFWIDSRFETTVLEVVRAIQKQIEKTGEKNWWENWKKKNAITAKALPGILNQTYHSFMEAIRSHYSLFNENLHKHKRRRVSFVKNK